MYEELCRVMSLNYVAYESEVVSPSGCCKQVPWKSTMKGKQADLVVEPATDADADKGDVDKKMRTMVRLNGKRDCKKCDIAVKDEAWYQMVKSAMASIWLRNSRLSNVHDFDVRR
jgi:hypothetical protein